MTVTTPPSDYHHHAGKARELLADCTDPTTDADRVRRADVHAALALGAALDAWYREWERPVDYAPATGPERAPVRQAADADDVDGPTARRRIYVASSWRNPDQPYLVTLLREDGHEVYDFRNPPGGAGFAWAETLSATEREALGEFTPARVHAQRYLHMLAHPRAQAGFDSDFEAMRWADTFVLVLPCGRSAHLELGWGIGAGKRTAILLDDPVTPELMYLGADALFRTIGELRAWLRTP